MVVQIGDLQIIRSGWTDRDDARAELDAYCNVMGGREATFAETNGQLARLMLVGSSFDGIMRRETNAGLAGAGITNADEFGNVVPWQ